jgi:GNAT superfamily N-acetyltransferase
MQPVTIRQVNDDEVEAVVPILLLAEPSELALRWSLAHLSDKAYVMCQGDERVAAATVRWRGDPAEIVELAVAKNDQMHGLGRKMVAWLIDEARRLGKHRLEVGTSNASIGNIRFYQRCGFRMDYVRRDYFWYNPELVVVDGIPVRDLLVFSMDLTGQDTKDRQSKRKRGG